MIRELDIVVLTKDLKEYGLRRGDVGVVVHRYANKQALEVEFITGEGKTIAVATLSRDDVRLMRQEEILHVRPMVSA
ncbi:MAG: DUF4926 domain-containing protein [Candidatus Bipolaricaulota bacterium]|nr:DUF4926 domain-containing protein [Candidatus Bipolaricaulota bacterium]